MRKLVALVGVLLCVCGFVSEASADVGWAPQFYSPRGEQVPRCAWSDATHSAAICDEQQLSCRLRAAVELAPAYDGLELVFVCVDARDPALSDYRDNPYPPRVVITDALGRIRSHTVTTPDMQGANTDDFIVQLLPGTEPGEAFLAVTAISGPWPMGTTIVGWSPGASSIAALHRERELSVELALGLLGLGGAPYLTGCAQTFRWDSDTFRYVADRTLTARQARDRCQTPGD